VDRAAARTLANSRSGGDGDHMVMSVDQQESSAAAACVLVRCAREIVPRADSSAASVRCVTYSTGCWSVALGQSNNSNSSDNSEPTNQLLAEKSWVAKISNNNRQVVADCGVDDEPLLARLVPLVTPHIAAVRATLHATSTLRLEVVGDPTCRIQHPTIASNLLDFPGFDFAHVVDVSWRLDHVLRSSAAGNVHAPVYYVQLTVQPPQGHVRDVTFSCSVEGLRDLVYRLQDATNAIEKIAGASPTTTPAAAIA
jgi:hypothetical protein